MLSQRPKEEEEDEEGITKQISDLDLSAVDLKVDNNIGVESVSELDKYEVGASQLSEVENEGDIVFDKAPLILGIKKKEKNNLMKLDKAPAIPVVPKSEPSEQEPKPAKVPLQIEVTSALPLSPSSSTNNIHLIITVTPVVPSNIKRFVARVKSTPNSSAMKPRPKLIPIMKY